MSKTHLAVLPSPEITLSSFPVCVFSWQSILKETMQVKELGCTPGLLGLSLHAVTFCWKPSNFLFAVGLITTHYHPAAEEENNFLCSFASLSMSFYLCLQIQLLSLSSHTLVWIPALPTHPPISDSHLCLCVRLDSAYLCSGKHSFAAAVLLSFVQSFYHSSAVLLTSLLSPLLSNFLCSNEMLCT